MLTFVEALSLAGDRNKQNDDALGFARGCAWVFDGATDLDDAPLSGAASDASWLAHHASAFFHAEAGKTDPRTLMRAASVAAREDFARIADGVAFERWKSPIASVVYCTETARGLEGVALGDCRVFALGADGAVAEAGPPPAHADHETALAATQTDADKPLLARTQTIAMLRTLRASQNQIGGGWTFCLDPHCADHAVAWRLDLARPAHVLLCTDGFAALADRYRAYDGAGLVRAALAKGLHALGEELRAIEAEDAASARHPRFKRSDDATAVLMRLS
ncbi:MAG: protein phosphatase 2C domain-containing protein [Hyphomonadaceae bacterium]